MINKKDNNKIKENYRLMVFRSNRNIYAAIINNSGNIVTFSSDINLKLKTNKVKKAAEVGKNLATKATKMNIKNVVFDRRGYKYHGRVKALAEGARASGLQF